MYQTDITVFKRPGGTWIAKRKGQEAEHPQGRGLSSIEAHGDLLEREAAAYAAEKGAS